jgi:hypothetical protein
MSARRFFFAPLFCRLLERGDATESVDAQFRNGRALDMIGQVEIRILGERRDKGRE